MPPSPEPPPMTEAERTKRLGAAYALLLDLAERRRAREAAQPASTTDPTPPYDEPAGVDQPAQPIP